MAAACFTHTFAELLNTEVKGSPAPFQCSYNLSREIRASQGVWDKPCNTTDISLVQVPMEHMLLARSCGRYQELMADLLLWGTIDQELDTLQTVLSFTKALSDIIWRIYQQNPESDNLTSDRGSAWWAFCEALSSLLQISAFSPVKLVVYLQCYL